MQTQIEDLPDDRLADALAFMRSIHKSGPRSVRAGESLPQAAHDLIDRGMLRLVRWEPTKPQHEGDDTIAVLRSTVLTSPMDDPASEWDVMDPAELIG